MIVKRTIQNSVVVAVGGIIEMVLSKYLWVYARTIKGKEQLIINLFARTVEIIPKQIGGNGGLGSIDILNGLRQKHSEGEKWYGVSNVNDSVCDTLKSFVWEPLLVKKNALYTPTEAACLILSIDETVANPQTEQESHEQMRGGMPSGANFGRGRMMRT